MLELLALGAVVVAGLAVFGLLWAVVSMFLWIVLLPFKLLGLVFRGIAVLLALPFLLVFAIIGAALFGAGALVFLVPALPFVLLVIGIAWLMRRRGARARVVAP